MELSKDSSQPKRLRRWWQRKRSWLAVVLFGFMGFLVSCSGTRTLMQTAPTAPKGPNATPPISISSQENWEREQKPRFLSLLQDHIYGDIPKNLSLSFVSAAKINGTHFENTANLEVRSYAILNKGTEINRNFGMVIVTPANAAAPVPIIMMQNFCPNHDVVPHPDIPKPSEAFFSCGADGMMANVFTYFFGRYITTPPISDIMTRGYALAIVYPSEFIPDNNTRGLEVLRQVFPNQGDTSRTGAIAAWASQFSLMAELFEDPR